MLRGRQRLLVGNEDLLQDFAGEFRAEFERLRGSHQRNEVKLRRELAEVERGIARCLDFILSGDGAPASVRSTLQDLEASKGRLEAELAGIDAALPLQVDIHPNVPKLYRRKVAAPADLLTDEETLPEAMEIIRSLIERIEVGPPEADRGPCAVTLVGGLASVLTFVAEEQHGGVVPHAGRSAAACGGPGMPKGHPVRDGLAGTLFVVAGAGLGPWRTRSIDLVCDAIAERRG